MKSLLEKHTAITIVDNAIREHYENVSSKKPYSFLEELFQIIDSSGIKKRDPGIWDMLQSQDFKIGYCGFKDAIVEILKPISILEIGVGYGMSALTFLTNNPLIRWVGIDHGEMDKVINFPMIDKIRELLGSRNLPHLIIMADSQLITQFSSGFDLIYIDGDHSREGACHDLISAWEAAPEWILIDDTNNTAVMAGVMDALFEIHNVRLKQGGTVEWAHFPDTWTGNILIRRIGC